MPTHLEGLEEKISNILDALELLWDRDPQVALYPFIYLSFNQGPGLWIYKGVLGDVQEEGLRKEGLHPVGPFPSSSLPPKAALFRIPSPSSADFLMLLVLKLLEEVSHQHY